MKKTFHIFLLVLVSGFSAQLSAQFTKVHLDADAEFKNAKELYQKEQFSLAYPVFKKLYSNGTGQGLLSEMIRLECRYYYIICGLQLNDSTAVPMALDFMEQENHPARLQMMRFHLGEYYFRKQDFASAQAQYAASNIANLSNHEIADMKFHQAYGYFITQQFDKAKPLFNAIRQLPKDPNYIDANYYFGFICFNDKNYALALESFQIAEKLPEYQPVVPFYIAEIYYFKGEREKALEYGLAALQKKGSFYDLQLKQLVGHLLFEKREFARALPYLQEYVSANQKVRREDLYELSYCYYEAKQWSRSIDGFKQLGGAQDSLAQNSMYLLADAYLKTNDKANARTAFQFCAANNSNAVQKEVSAYHYGKLSYELGYMDAALQSFRSFIAAYPKSNYIQEARELLVNTLANTSNYKAALQLYESLGTKSDQVIKLYPRLLYGSAVELINDQQIDQADALLTRVLQAPYNNAQLPLTYFWKGEIAYRKGQTEASIAFFQNYLKNPVINGEVNLVNAKYSLAYGYMKNEQYAMARDYFEQITRTVSAASTAIEQDAYLRTADCYFMGKDFKQSLKMYEQVLAQQLPSADYALYQKGIIAGATNKNPEKISLLQSLERVYPNSALVPDANLEIANTYLADENFQQAIVPLQKLVKDPKAANMGPQAYLKLGVAYFNMDKNEESLASFQKLVTSYPDTQESNDAIDYIRNIFVEKQQPGEFAAFMKQNGKPITHLEEDSLTFRSSMLRYEARDFAAARTGFADYLNRFPDGRYSLEANYFTAEIQVVNKMNTEALPFYKAVADRGQSKYAERSALQAARIYYFDLKDYANAARYFTQLKSIAAQQENRLEAMRGLLRCQFKAQQWKEAATNASELLQEKGIATDDRMMASMVVAKNHQLSNESDAAISAYKQVIAAGKSEYAAEAQFRIAEIQLQQNKLADAEKSAFEVIKKMGSYEFWVTRSYILLGDLFVQQKDWFNAEATFKSIVENATIAELKTEAQQRLDKVLTEKNKTNQVEQQ
ncbi:MAG: tetratricopeptide repeat protein [Bacteroidetes bacterium]|nr:tetratricopeptide repeat protein [Bacteroidota bacterium]